MKALLRRIDMFGTPAKLNTFGKDSFKTGLGGIMTILTVATLVFFSYIFGTDFYHKENPRVVQNEKMNKKSKVYKLTSSRDPFMIKLNDGFGKTFDYATIPYKMHGIYYHFKKDTAGTWQTALAIDEAFIPCTQTKVKENIELANQLVLADWFCFDWELITEIGRKELKDINYEAQLMGSRDENEYTFFRFDVRNAKYDARSNLHYDISPYSQLIKVSNFGLRVEKKR